MRRKFLIFSILVLMLIIIAGMVSSLIYPYKPAYSLTNRSTIDHHVSDISRHNLAVGQRLVVINNPGRQITIRGEDRADLQLSITKWVTGPTEMTRSVLNAIKVSFQESETVTTIVVDCPAVDGIDYLANVVLYVPKRLVLDLAMDNGAIFVENMEGHVTISNLLGQVKFDGVINGPPLTVIMNN